MPIIDSQVHAYEANTPKRPWKSVPNWPPSATGDETVAGPRIAARRLQGRGCQPWTREGWIDVDQIRCCSSVVNILCPPCQWARSLRGMA